MAAIGLADMVSGIFKSNGVLGGLLPDFEPRPILGFLQVQFNHVYSHVYAVLKCLK